MADYDDCPKYLQEFLFYMQTIKGRSKKTVDGYYIDLRTFFRYLKCVKMEHIDPANTEQFDSRSITNIPIEVLGALSLGDIYGFLNYTAEDRENSAKTRSRKVSAIRALFQYLTVKSNYLKVNPVENLDVPTTKKTVPRYLTLEECLDLLTGMDPSSATYGRDYCMVTLFLNCGMRLSELVGINLQDIRREDKTLRLLGKGNKERIIYLNDACFQALDAHLASRKATSQEKHKNALFLSSRGTRITPRRVEQIMEGCFQQAGLGDRGYSPHKLRHTAATLMYQHGNVDIRVLKEILGHANLGTTEIYTHLSDRQMENAANSSPLARVAPRQNPAKGIRGPESSGSEGE